MSVKIKKVKIPLNMKDEGLAEMFNQMLGTGSVNMSIAYPRYIRIKHLCTQLVTLFEHLASSPFMRKTGTEFEEERKEITLFCVSSRQIIHELFKIDLSDYEWNLDLVEDAQKNAFMNVYELVKKSNLVNTFVKMCDNLVKYKKNFENSDKLNHKFVNAMPGSEWKPFPFTNLNIKHIYSLTNVGDNTIRFFMIILNKAFEFSYKLFDEIQSPDIDVDQFAEIIMSNIEQIQKQPQLHRCDKAFQKIKESVGLLKNQFNNYYRDFIATNDSTIMMQHFIIDVSKSTEVDPVTTGQFRTIINYYRKIAQDQISNPKLKMLFDRVNESFKEMERGTENLVGVRMSSPCADDESDPILVSSMAVSSSDLKK